MTDEQIEEQVQAIQRVTNELLKSKKAARKFLRDAGIPKADEPFNIKKKDRHA